MSEKHTVTKPFKTPSRKFGPGQEIDASDVDGPVPFGEWVKKGFVTPPAKKAAPAKAAPATQEQADTPAS